MKDIKNIVAFDCGNSSIRVILGRFDGESMQTQVVHQVEQKEIAVNGYFYWDILRIFTELKRGLMMAHRQCGRIDSAGVCTWGIDFGMIGHQGQLLGNPLCYRNGMGAKIIEELSEQEQREMFDLTGIQNHQMNSLYQLAAYEKAFPEQAGAAESILLIPDLLCYLFTGEKKGERSIASTTQYYNVTEKQYSDPVLLKFSLDASLFPPLADNGDVIGTLSQHIADELKINRFPFVCVPSHDTASAVAAVPADEKDFIFLSSGTWGLIGTELEEPIVNDEIYQSGLTNEQGAFSTITLLKNGAGMYIVQRIRAELSVEGKKLSWDEMVKMAQRAKDDSLLFDPNDERLFNPPCMIDAIREILRETGQNGDCSIEEIIRAFYESVAMSYKYTADQISAVTKKEYKGFYIIGGGSNNMFLNQLVASATGMNVTAGPAEATSLGNVMVQLAHFDDKFYDLSALRTIVRRSIKTRQFKPQVSSGGKYNRFLEYIK